MTDSYLFSKSTLPQGVETETPFISKNWNYINDINGGVYQNSSGLSLVQFDLSSIYNSTQLVDPSTMFMAIPITYVSAYAGSSALIAPNNTSWASTALKNGYFQLIHGVDLQVNGKTLEQFIPNLNSYVSFKLMSQMSNDDLRTYGATLGMGDTLDNWESQIFNGSANSQVSSGTFPSGVVSVGNGNGLTNNCPYPIAPVQYAPVTSTIVTTGATTLAQTVATNTAIKPGMLVQGNGISPLTFVANYNGTTTMTLTGTTGNTTTNGITTTGTVSNQVLTFLSPVGANQGDQSISGIQHSGAYNNGLFSRMKRLTDVSQAPTAGSANLYGNASGTQTNCITNSTKLANEFKPFYTVLNTNYMVWYDVAVVRMADILDSMRAMPMMKKWDGVFRCYLNVGQVVSNIADTGSYSATITSPCLATSGAGNTFTNTCPLIHTAIPTPRGVTGIASGLFIASPTDTAISCAGATINLRSAGASHFLTSCRMYYTQIQLKPEKLDYYISNNRSKKICWTSILNNNFNNISAGSTFSTLVQSGVSNPRGLLILPFLSNSTGNQLTNYGAVTSNGSTLVTSFTTFAQQLSPFDMAPATTSNASLINLQVAVGGVNVLANVISYGFEEFIQQVSLYEKINAGDFGLSCGLISQAHYENAYRVYYVDLSRANIADLMTPRNITISFTNNSLQALDIQVFTEYFREGVVDVETGLVSV
jgi:hypothetical protein